MKRVNNLFERICEFDNLHRAYEKARLRKSKKYGVLMFEKNLNGNLAQIQNELLNGTYRTSEYEIFTIFEPKERLIYRLPFRDRVVQHAIMNILEPIWTPMFVSQTYSCIKGRGIHGALKHLKKGLKDVENTHYCLKLDIRKFYPSIDHDILKTIVRKKIKDMQLLYLLDGIIDSAPGVPIGNYLSQFFANLYLSYFDHWLKEEMQVKYYYRYADDIVILAADKAYLHALLAEINHYLMEFLNLQMKGNYQIFPVEKRGIDFVGYVFYHTHIRMRKSIKKNFCRRVAKLNKKDLTPKEYKKRIAPYLGWSSHCNSKHLLKKINMKKFSELGISNALDDKQVFPVPVISVSDLVNCEIEVIDFEAGVKTKHGEDRCVVKIKFEGAERKFFTNATPIKQVLSQIPKTEFPFLVTIKQQRFGSGSGRTYYFS
ncbi:MAG: reverse transcriptase/maturase family protein [Prevotellaceae bacterium]|jgi:retron-type reverse transcriptase|nr:reverse transcriptase/maturase family protein [Prevotellaceae bacterium]